MTDPTFPNNEIGIDTGELYSEAISLLKQAANELGNIHRTKDFAMWRDETKSRLAAALSMVEPFATYKHAQTLRCNGDNFDAMSRLGDWAVTCLVKKLSPENIVNSFVDEADRNSAVYIETSPVLGVQIDETTMLDKGVCIEAMPTETIDRALFYSHFPKLFSFFGTSLLKQDYFAAPAFHPNPPGEMEGHHASPDLNARQSVRENVRLACVVASSGPVEIHSSLQVPKYLGLFVEPPASSDIEGFECSVVKGTDIQNAYSGIVSFPDKEIMIRAINRLGRSRLADSPIDRSLELGIAAEILLMHDHSSSNTEITYKISTRAGWLIGSTSNERRSIFDEMKALYHARSQAVHLGKLSSVAKVDLDAADTLVSRVIKALLERGCFPDWTSLVMG
ncbi:MULTISPECIES: hypothetical protein [Alphaproteobacteria]|uniref:hypothetical protein n=1 Tax=Alphaproteobacteria TaxID=28211 RepID=UPI003A8EDF79